MRVILKQVLEEISPSADERKKALGGVKKFLSELNAQLKSKKASARAVLGGSYAKDTWLAGDYDVDIFVLFDVKKKDKNISDILEKALKKWKYQRIHGSRDYFWVNDGIKYEIVPVLDIKRANQAENVTDFSPKHVAWVKKSPKFKDDIRLAKKFCKAAKCYGAESYIRGFSGHVIDILTIHYKGFRPLLKAAIKWKPKVVIDHNKVYKGKALFVLNTSKTDGPLVLIDPVQPDRNAAAALMEKNLDIFVKAAKAFLKKPSKSAFVEKPIDFDKLGKKGTLIKIAVKTVKGKEDVAGTKFVRAFEYIGDRVQDFKLKDSGWLWDKEAKGTWWFLFGKDKLPPTMERKGPPTKMKDAVKVFKKKYKKITTRAGRLWTQVKRESTTPKDAIQKLMKHPYVKERTKGVKIQ